MPLFQYQALDKDGKRKKGTLEAMNVREAKNLLRSQSLMVSHITEKTGFAARENLQGEQLQTFTLQLAQLVNAGLPLYESLLVLEEQSRGEPYHRILLSICDKIKTGTPLSQAMSAFPDSFNTLYCSLIAAGESVGALAAVLERLSQLLQRQNKLKNQIITAMIYPAILSVFCLLVIFLLLGFVVPSIEGIFVDRQLNFFTQLVISVSHLFNTWWWLFFPLLIVIIIVSYFQLRSQKGRNWLERTVLKIPIFKNLVIQTAVARFSRTMATLLDGGLPMIDSLQIARSVMRNVILEEEIQKAEIKVVEGSSLSIELSKSNRIPQMVSRMIKVGEDSGSTALMMSKIADMYEGQLEKTLDRVMALAQPVILIAMGLIIGSVLLAILLPLTDMSSFAV